MWRAENPNRVREMNDSMSQTLDDNYVKTALRDRAATPELIEMKREQLMLYRLTKQLFETIKEVSGNESDRVDESPVGDGPEE